MSITEQLAPEINMEEAETFMMKVGEIVNSGAVAVMLSIGHKTGLLDSMAGTGVKTSQQIANMSDLSERYVREWLAVMVTGGIVKYYPEGQAYELPDTHAACLTRNAPLGNLAVHAQFIPMVGAIEDPILECFKTGEGTSYGDYPCFHQIMSEDSDGSVVANLFQEILPLVPGLADRLKQGIDVLDAGCGRGHALSKLAEHFPKSRFFGYDLCDDAIASAREYARELDVTNVSFEVRDLTDFEDKGRFDLITSFDAVHDQKHPEDFIHRLKQALRPDGVYLMQDIGGSSKLENNYEFPFAAFLYTASCLHCMPISLGQGGDGLGTMWGWEVAEHMLQQAGYKSIERHVFEHDPLSVWFISKT